MSSGISDRAARRRRPRPGPRDADHIRVVRVERFGTGACLGRRARGEPGRGSSVRVTTGTAAVTPAIAGCGPAPRPRRPWLSCRSRGGNPPSTAGGICGGGGGAAAALEEGGVDEGDGDDGAAAERGGHLLRRRSAAIDRGRSGAPAGRVCLRVFAGSRASHGREVEEGCGAGLGIIAEQIGTARGCKCVAALHSAHGFVQVWIAAMHADLDRHRAELDFQAAAGCAGE